MAYTPEQPTPSYQAAQQLIEGLRSLRTGALLLIVALLIGVAGGFMSAALFYTLPSGRVAELGTALIGLGVLAVSLILAIAVFVIWARAAGRLAAYDPSRLGVGRTGVRLELAGLGLMLLGVLAIIAAAASGSAGLVLGGLGLIGVGALLVLVGVILFGIMLMRLSEIEGVDPGFKTAGILFILTIVPYIGPILGLVSVVMIYVYAGRSIENLERGPATPPPPGPPPPIHPQ